MHIHTRTKHIIFSKMIWIEEKCPQIAVVKTAQMIILHATAVKKLETNNNGLQQQTSCNKKEFIKHTINKDFNQMFSQMILKSFKCFQGF